VGARYSEDFCVSTVLHIYTRSAAPARPGGEPGGMTTYKKFKSIFVFEIRFETQKLCNQITFSMLI